MKSVEAITLKLRIDPDMADRLNMSRFVTRGPMQRKPCWTVSDNIAMIDTVVRQWKCAPIYIIQDIEKKVDEVFDGAHRCEAIFDCINDVFRELNKQYGANIRLVCNGKRQTAFGYKWEWVNE